jgi:plastocyanin
MRKSNLAVSAAAAATLILGSIGMAAAQTPTSHSAGHTHGIVGEDASLTQGPSEGGLPKLVGKVNDARDITLSDTTLAPGRYKIVVRDSTTSHNWHLFGNGQSRATSVVDTGRSVFRIRLTAGTYTVHCDRHPGSMTFDVHVS